MKKSALQNLVPCALFILLCGLMCLVNLGPERPESPGSKERARVLQADNSNVERLGLALKGEQMLKVKILSGSHKGEVFDAQNVLRAQMDFDKMFEPGDDVLVSILDGADCRTDTINAQDHYRLGLTAALFCLFAFLLVVFGGWTGAKALVSFAFCCAAIWKILIPLCLRGANPILVSVFAVFILSAVIIFLVAGFTKKGFSALSGTMMGVLASCAAAWIFAGLFKINGAVMPFSQALLYSGYENLSLSDLYIGGVFLSSSGAVMDLSMDVASGMEEVGRFRANFKTLFFAGIRIGRSVVGTMSTTLLLAYAGGYLTLLMAFMANGAEPADFLNNPYIACESVKTLVGSFGLVLVAPFTALAGAFIMSEKK